jgi:hypothetical protein
MKKKKKIKKHLKDIEFCYGMLSAQPIIPPFFGRKKFLREVRDNEKYIEGFTDALKWVLRDED